MEQQYFIKIAQELKVKPWQVSATVALLDEDATIPFISRYRKEATGTLDEMQITEIRESINRLRELDKRREVILKSLEEREILTTELEKSIMSAQTMTKLEDIYLPYRPKRKTRGTVAKEKGLQPLAEKIFSQENFDLKDFAHNFIDEEKDVKDLDEALVGARDIIAEWVNENAQARDKIRNLYKSKAVITSEVFKDKNDDNSKFKDYFEFSENIAEIPSHRFLALMRGQRENVLFLNIQPSKEQALEILNQMFVKNKNESSTEVEKAVEDAYNRLLSTSMETEIRMLLKQRADKEAIKVFTDNLRQLLLYPPLGNKNVMALDPGFRTGCKIVCLDKHGYLLHNDTIYPNPPQKEEAVSEGIVKRLCEKFNIEIIAVGNGTAGRETESFVKQIDFGKEMPVVMVSESGASVYSASKVAREEFPKYDVTVRGAVSIGRRLMDPLAELVKIDPKSIGVGQYQHDVDQRELKKALDDVVISCVNAVGVDINTASKELLTYVSGLNSRLAKSIVDYRHEKGEFKSRLKFNEIPYLGPKAFEQASGFLRIQNADNPLDSSAVHPESYDVVYNMADDLGCTVKDLMDSAELRKKIDLNKYVDHKRGLPTLKDILSELEKPGRDPREKLEIFKYDDRVQEIDDLKPGMKLPGIVTNITNFGAFVDIGVHQDGLVHISQLSDDFVSDPTDIVKVHQNVMVTVMDVDKSRKRISLSMKSAPEMGTNNNKEQKQKARSDKKVKVQAKRETPQISKAVKKGKPTIEDLMNKFNK